MISETALTQAIERGVISAAQADALRAPAAEARPAQEVWTKEASAKEALPPPPPPLPASVPMTTAKPPPLPLEASFNRQDDEALRFVTSFADIFVSLGIALFFSSAAYLLSRQLGTTAMWAVLAVLAWFTAELFT